MKIDDKHGTYVCTECGIISPVPVYDQTSEYRNFAIEHGVKDKSRSSYSGDDNGTNLGTSVQRTGSKESKLLFEGTQRYTTDQKVAKLRKNLRRIQELTTRLNLNKEIQRDAKNFYKLAEEKGLIKTQRKGAIDAVCVSFACIKNKSSMKKEDIISQVEDITVKDFKNVQKNFEEIKPAPLSFAEVAKSEAAKLGYPPYIQDTIYEIGRQAEEKSIFPGKKTESVVAALIVFVNQYLREYLKRPTMDILQLEGVAEGTVTNHVKTLQNDKELDVMSIPKFKELLEKMKKPK